MARMSDFGALGISVAYVLGILALAEILRTRNGLPGEFTRKFVHIAIGTWIVPTFHLFQSLAWAVALPAAFIGINALSYKLKFFAAIEQEDGKNLGTILMPVSFVVLLLVFWNTQQREAAMLGLLCLAWGDAFAAIIGRAYGRMRFRVLGEVRLQLRGLRGRAGTRAAGHGWDGPGDSRDLGGGGGDADRGGVGARDGQPAGPAGGSGDRVRLTGAAGMSFGPGCAAA